MLLKDDKFVVVQRGDVLSEFSNDEVPTLVADLDERVRYATAIAVVEQDRTNSFLAEDGSWIRSKLTLKLVKPIKDSPTPLFDRKGYVTVDHDGGELTINGVRVRAGRYYEFLPNQRYLVFLRSTGPGYVGFIGMQLKINKENRITPIDLSNGNVATAPSPLYGLPLKDLLAEFRRRVKP